MSGPVSKTRQSSLEGRLSIPRGTFLAEVLIDIDALPDNFAEALEFQQTPPRLAVELAAQASDQFGDEAQLIGRTESCTDLFA